MEHTKGKWFSDYFGNITNHPTRTGLKMFLPDSGIIAKCCESILPTDKRDAKANARHICQCVNAFEEGGLVEELVNECEKILTWLRQEASRCIEQAKVHKGRFDALSDALSSDSSNYKAMADGLDKAIAKAKKG